MTDRVVQLSFGDISAVGLAAAVGTVLEVRRTRRAPAVRAGVAGS